MSDKNILIKPLRLEIYFKSYTDKNKKQEVFNKFETVWGTSLANHFLSKYSDAESLIWALDSDNMLLFINKF